MVARSEDPVSEPAGPAPALPPPPPHPGAGEIRAVAFDCYGTLLDFEERAFAPALDDLLRDCGATHTDGETVWKAWMAHAREHGRQHGRDPERPLAGPEPDFFSFAESWTAHFEVAFTQTKVTGIAPGEATGFLFDLLAQAPVYDEVHEVISGLRARGLQLAVASNADDAHLEPALERHGIRELVDAVISSEGVRSYKPRRPFFEAIQHWSGLQAQEVLYVGDSPYADVTGSRSVGMGSYWVHRYADEERDKLLHHEPTWRFADLCGLLDVLDGAAS